MNSTLVRLPLLLVTMLALTLTLSVDSPALAQDRGEDRGGDRENWRERWENASEEEREKMREEMRQRWSERQAERDKQRANEMRERLGMSEEDFEAVSPLIEKVRSAARDREMARRGSRGSFGRGGAPTGGEPSEHVKSATEAMSELREAIEDDNSGDIKDALAKLRKARAALDKNLSDAREELRSICTAKWEAEFVMMGLLD